MVTREEGTIGVLVADSGAFIKNALLEQWSKNIVTVREVVSEIRDVGTRTRLQVLPYDLSFREPSHEALHHVTAFAKKTGDYQSLSVVDLQVMALTYQLECELGPTKGAHLRKEPARTQLAAEKPKIPGVVGFYSGTKRDKKAEGDKIPGVVGFYSGSKRDRKAEGDKIPGVVGFYSGTKRDRKAEGDKIPGVVGFYSGTKRDRKAEGDKKVNSSSEDDQVLQQLPAVSVPGNETEAGCSERTGDSVHQDADSPLELTLSDGEGKEPTGDIPVERNGDGSEEPSDEEWDEDSDDLSGWITPENLQQACEEMGGATEVKPVGIAVGCITTDFAMQNVMLQMGLNVISVSGMRIKQLRNYALKCKACFKTTSKTSEVFCPSCGHRTLVKVSMSVDAEGVVHYRPLSRKQFSHRGLKYSLPLPKGGRHSDTPILTADQKNTYKERRRRVNKVDPLDPDYIARSSPFATHDVTSRGSRVAFAKGGKGRGEGRRNPNAVRPKGKRK